MGNPNHTKLTDEQRSELLKTLEKRFENNRDRHKDIHWVDLKERLVSDGSRDKIDSLYKMEETGGEPDVVGYNKTSDEFIFIDCSKESPAKRRSLCYDQKGLTSRKKYKPSGNAVDTAAEMGVELLTEDQYKDLQKSGPFDTKTSSWLKTPDEVRENGGAIFGDYRYGRVFIYHNGAESYYKSRGFRGCVCV